MNFAELTERRKIDEYQVYKFFKNYFVKNLANPSVREVADWFNITPKGAWDCLNTLKEKGYLTKYKGSFRLHGVKIELKWSVDQ